MVTETTGVLGGYFQGKLCLNIPSDASVRPRPLRGGTAEGKACPGQTSAGEKTVSTDDGGSSMDLNTRKILSLFASILFTIPVYIILHEGGMP